VTFTIDKQNIADEGTYTWTTFPEIDLTSDGNSRSAIINENTKVTVEYTVGGITYTDTETI
jgi:hypothetical protein